MLRNTPSYPFDIDLTKPDPLHIGETLPPGTVVYFTSGKSSPVAPTRAERSYRDRLRSMTLRHGLRYEERPAPQPWLAWTTAARRFAAGSLKTEAYVFVSPHLGVDNMSASLGGFFDHLLEFNDWSADSIDATEAIWFDDGPSYPRSWGFGVRYRSLSSDEGVCADNDDTCEAPESEPESCMAEEMPTQVQSGIITDIKPDPEVDDECEPMFFYDDPAQVERLRMLHAIGRLVQEYVKRYGRMPDLGELTASDPRARLLDSKRRPSVVINQDLRVVLVDMDEVELRLTPLQRTVYILFLLHPEGIVLKEIGDHRRQLEEIYALVKPGAGESQARESIDSLCEPGGESLLQKISRIRQAVKALLMSPELVDHYSIGGRRGEPYRLGASAQLTQWPRVLA